MSFHCWLFSLLTLITKINVFLYLFQKFSLNTLDVGRPGSPPSRETNFGLNLLLCLLKRHIFWSWGCTLSEGTIFLSAESLSRDFSSSLCRSSPYKDSCLTLPGSLPNSPSLSASLLSDWLDGKDMLPVDMDEIQKELESNSVLALFQEMDDSWCL